MLEVHSGEFGVNDIGVLVPVVNAHPHLLVVSSSSQFECEDPTNLSECTQPRQDAAANPCRVLPLRRCKDLYPHVLDRQLLQLREQSITEALGESAAS
jgi:hypothetical protein